MVHESIFPEEDGSQTRFIDLNSWIRGELEMESWKENRGDLC